MYERPGSKHDPIVPLQSDSSPLPQLTRRQMEKAWFRQAPGAAQWHSDVPKGTNRGISVLFPQSVASGNHLYF